MQVLSIPIALEAVAVVVIMAAAADMFLLVRVVQVILLIQEVRVNLPQQVFNRAMGKLLLPQLMELQPQVPLLEAHQFVQMLLEIIPFQV
jgi:hypothetical protein